MAYVIETPHGPSCTKHPFLSQSRVEQGLSRINQHQRTLMAYNCHKDPTSAVDIDGREGYYGSDFVGVEFGFGGFSG